MPLNSEEKKSLLTTIGENIRRIRKSKNMTQADLAFTLDAYPGKVGRTERGEYDFKISSLFVIAEGMDVDICELLKTDEK